VRYFDSLIRVAYRRIRSAARRRIRTGRIRGAQHVADVFGGIVISTRGGCAFFVTVVRRRYPRWRRSVQYVEELLVEVFVE
jgi:hypothetical protein